MLSPDPKIYVVCEIECPSIVHKTVFVSQANSGEGARKQEARIHSIPSKASSNRGNEPSLQTKVINIRAVQPALGMKYALYKCYYYRKDTYADWRTPSNDTRQLQAADPRTLSWKIEPEEDWRTCKSLLHKTGEHLTYCLSLDLETKGLKKRIKEIQALGEFKKKKQVWVNAKAQRAEEPAT